MKKRKTNRWAIIAPRVQSGEVIVAAYYILDTGQIELLKQGSVRVVNADWFLGLESTLRSRGSRLFEIALVLLRFDHGVSLRRLVRSFRFRFALEAA